MTPNLAYIQELYGYNDWANDRVLGAVANVEPDLYKRSLGSSFESLHDTVAHILAAEWIWLERWFGRSPAALPKGSDFAGLDEITHKLHEVRSERKRWFSSLSADALSQTVNYRNLRGHIYGYPLWQQLTHVVNHSTYHRGQVITMLRQLGQEVVSTDFLLLYDERNERASAAGQK
ncbi:MAG TPA: DinB family protein [Terriglobales bacterium]|nr:DinB family protein [Terriglobales bacterium]